MPNDAPAALTRYDPDIGRMALEGLLAPRKTLPPALFYDEEGCRLFYRITELPEYYLTRTERGLLAELGPAVAADVGPSAVLVEYGASHEEKAGFLLAAEGAFQTYIPIDVAAPELARLRTRMAAIHPALSVRPVVADFMHPVVLPALPTGAPVLGFFPGSTIGNLEPAAARDFLIRARNMLGPGARFLVGADLRKAPDVLIPAYDDAAGVTAAFNRNLLVRLNREAGADFEPAAFQHMALWNDAESRIEMHLVSLRDQTVRLAGAIVRFAEGETIHTENSYKHTPERLLALARAAGWMPRRQWTDPAGRFGHFLLDAG
jgi:L-histidine Nalpha-methyltransferase